ncbi:hypothetical protein [Ralstonia phage phiRSL1]|uniref:Uncharacterized protein n=1 Tax=Ralstonia phage phiRSL1 TaxID=1980924 RepID=B2ZY62_9CAUD|nr:tail fiber protein [Ralstonia phage phiRSL1]BAG41630.1 hypothetical protein [Ralstonia phage phiRSL1]
MSILSYPITVVTGSLQTYNIRARWVSQLPLEALGSVDACVLQEAVGPAAPGLYWWTGRVWMLAVPYDSVTDAIIHDGEMTIGYNLSQPLVLGSAADTVNMWRNGQPLPGNTIAPDDSVWAGIVSPNPSVVGVTSVNHKTADANGDVEVGISDIPGLTTELAARIKTVNSVGPDSNGDVAVTLAGLPDTNFVPSPAIDGFTLVYQTASGKWVPSRYVPSAVRTVNSTTPDVNGNVIVKASAAETVTPTNVSLVANDGSTTGNILLKTVQGTGALTVADNGTHVTLDVPQTVTAVQAATATGGTTLIANDGSTTHIAQIKQLVAGVNVQLSSDGQTVTINATNSSGGGGTLTAVQSTGTGISLVNYDGTSGSTIALIKSVVAGSGITIVQDAQLQTLTIAAIAQVPPVTSVNTKTGDVVLTAADITGFATVAYTGNYNDLQNKPAAYVLPPATATVLGGIKVGSNLAVAADGTLSATAQPLAPATTTTLGGVIVGAGLNVAADGTLSVSGSGVVNSVNSASGALTIAQGSGISVSTVGQTITISATGAGSVTSVGLSLPAALFTVSGSPVTSTGTLTGTLNNQNPNWVWAGPGSGVAAAPTFRALVAADLPVATSTVPGTMYPGPGLAVDGTGKLTIVQSGVVTSFNTRTGDITLQLSDITNAGGAVLASPAFTGTPTAPTPLSSDNSTRLATTAFVQASFAPLASPALVGTPTAPTAATGTATTQLATTAFVNRDFAPIASPTFTGTPKAPTQTAGDNTTALATTAFVQAAISGAVAGVTSFNSRTGAVTLQAGDVTGVGGALLASPAFTGTPTAPTATAGTNTTQLATTAFVQAAIASVPAGVSSFNTRQGAVVLQPADVTGVGGALLASPAFTGTPTAPTATAGTNTTQIATTAFVQAAITSGVPIATTTTLGGVIVKAGLTVDASGNLSANVTTVAGRTGDVVLAVGDVSGAASLSSPAFTGTPTAPTAASGTNNTQIATTTFANTAATQTETSLNLSAGGSISLGGGSQVLTTIFTGTLTANTTVVLPAPGRWTFYNNTSGAFTVTLSNGAGSTFVLPQTASVTVISDATLGVIPAITTGLTQSTSDNSTNLATTAFVKAAISGSVSGVSSFNTRTGAVTLQASDVTGVGGALLSGAAFTGAVTVPTPSTGDNSTNAATTAFVQTSRLNGTSISLSSANVTLTAAQYGTRIILLNGTLTANVSVTFPTSGSWEVYNATTGGFTVTLTNGSGTTLTLAQNNSATIMSYSGGITNSNSVAGVLPVATTTTLGGVIVPAAGGLLVDGSGNLSVVVATSSARGVVSQGTGVSINASGVLSANVVSVAGKTGAVTLVVGDVSGAAALASPSFTGTPTAPTAAASTNTTQLATTAFVRNAVAGVTTVSLTNVNVTLTADQAAAAIIKLSGTLTGNVQITFPTSGWWEVYNTTTGSFTVTLTNGTGSNITIPQNQMLNVVSDATSGMLLDGAAAIARISVNVQGSPAVGSEIFYPVTNALTLPANLVGTNAYGTGTSGSSAPYTVNVYKYVGNSASGTQVGTITINPGSASTFSTVGGTSVSYAAGDRLSYQFPTANLALFAATLLGTWQ